MILWNGEGEGMEGVIRSRFRTGKKSPRRELSPKRRRRGDDKKGRVTGKTERTCNNGPIKKVFITKERDFRNG